MPSRHRLTGLDTDESLVPSWTTRMHDYEGQVREMARIRQLSQGIVAQRRERDEVFVALALSNSLSRKDMARAAGLSKPRVDQIIRELVEEKQRKDNVAAAERVRRHMP